jgi:hypothetical protein
MFTTWARRRTTRRDRVLTRTPPFRAPRAPVPPVPPCWRNPDGWMIEVAGGYQRAAEAIRAAVAGCLNCKTIAPANYTACTRTPREALAPRTIVAGRVVSAGQRLVDPARYIAVTLRHLRPLPGEIMDAMDRDNGYATRAERAAARTAATPRTQQDPGGPGPDVTGAVDRVAGNR